MSLKGITGNSLRGASHGKVRGPLRSWCVLVRARACGGGGVLRGCGRLGRLEHWLPCLTPSGATFLCASFAAPRQPRCSRRLVADRFQFPRAPRASAFPFAMSTTAGQLRQPQTKALAPPSDCSRSVSAWSVSAMRATFTELSCIPQVREVQIEEMRYNL